MTASRHHFRWAPLVGALAILTACDSDDGESAAAEEAREWMIVGLDQKVTWGDSGVVFSEGGSDRVVIYDLARREEPQVVFDEQLSNSVFGPPVNLSLSPDSTLALVADSTVHVADGDGGWAFEPATGMHVLDMDTQPPSLIETLEVGRQPSGLSFNPSGDLALVANRNAQTLSVLEVSGKSVSVTGSVEAGGEQLASVVFTPDGTLAVATKFQEAGKVAFFDVAGTSITYRGVEADLEVGAWPYNVAITPNGRLALTADNGANGASDGTVNTVSVIDLDAEPPVVLTQVDVGDGPEGLAISPLGDLAVVALIDGSNAQADATFRKDVGSVVALSIEGTDVTVVGDPIAVGALPEGVVFSPDGQYVYIGNYLSETISILEVVNGGLVDTGRTIQTTGQPASMR